MELLVGQRLLLSGHFDVPVVLEQARPRGAGYEGRVRLPDGRLEEAIISAAEAEKLTQTVETTPPTTLPVDAEGLRLLIESARSRLAYAYDPRRLDEYMDQVAFYLDPLATTPYLLHFFEIAVRGKDTR